MINPISILYCHETLPEVEEELEPISQETVQEWIEFYEE